MTIATLVLVAVSMLLNMAHQIKEDKQIKKECPALYQKMQREALQEQERYMAPELKR